MTPANLLDIAATSGIDELFEDLLARPGLRIERIVSRGHTTPPDEPYVQSWDEWVLVVQGSARLRLEGHGEQVLAAGAAKDALKARGYRWDAALRFWWRTVPEEELDAERTWLMQDVYRGRGMPAFFPQSACERYSR